MDNWRIHLVIVTFCALVQIYQGLSLRLGEEPGVSKAWQDETLRTGLTHPIAMLMKRSKALRFYGLMGKRSGTKKPFEVKKRNKEETLVDLMGRSIYSGESLTGIKSSVTTPAINIFKKPRKFIRGMGPNPVLMELEKQKYTL